MQIFYLYFLKLQMTQFSLKIFIFAFIFSACSPMSEIQLDPTIDLNGGFEQSKNELPYNWYFYTPKTVKKSEFKIFLDQNIYKEGKQSLHFSVTKCSQTGGHLSPGFSQEFSMEAGKKYTVLFWLKNKGCQISAKLGQISIKTGDYKVIKVDKNNNEWELISLIYQTKKTENPSKLRFEFNVLSKGECWVDGFEIKPL